MPEIIKNDKPGCWAFGVSRDASVGVFCIHFAAWHFTWVIESKEQSDE